MEHAGVGPPNIAAFLISQQSTKRATALAEPAWPLQSGGQMLSIPILGHCERSEAIHRAARSMDCFASLAKTAGTSFA
jgi:hypothetical protein